MPRVIRLRVLLARLTLPRCNYCRKLVERRDRGAYAYCSDTCRRADVEEQAATT